MLYSDPALSLNATRDATLRIPNLYKCFNYQLGFLLFIWCVWPCVVSHVCVCFYRTVSEDAAGPPSLRGYFVIASEDVAAIGWTSSCILLVASCVLLPFGLSRSLSLCINDSFVCVLYQWNVAKDIMVIHSLNFSIDTLD